MYTNGWGMYLSRRYYFFQRLSLSLRTYPR